MVQHRGRCRQKLARGWATRCGGTRTPPERRLTGKAHTTFLGSCVPLPKALPADVVARGLFVEALPALRDGYTPRSWEAAVAAVCSRHLDTIQAMILKHTRRTPDKLCIVYKDRQWTFQQVRAGRSRAAVSGSEAAVRRGPCLTHRNGRLRTLAASFGATTGQVRAAFGQL